MIIWKRERDPDLKGLWGHVAPNLVIHVTTGRDERGSACWVVADSSRRDRITGYRVLADGKARNVAAACRAGEAAARKRLRRGA